MSQNIEQIYVANPAVAMASTDLLYLGRSPYNTADDFAITWSDMEASITAVGTVTSGTWNATTLAIAHGGTGVTSVTTTPTANAWAGWNTNSQLSAHNFLASYTTTATNGGTTTLTTASNYFQFFTGSSTETVVLPVTSTLALGQGFVIVNRSSGAVTVNASDSSLVQVMAANTRLELTCISTSGTSNAAWDSLYLPTAITLPVTVPYGGTGLSSATAYGIIAGGTTSTGDFQVVSPGLAGQYLQATGVSSLPQWASVSGVFTTTTISGTTQAAAVATRYIALNAGQTTVTLPSTYAVGDVIALVGSTANTGGWILTANTGDTIRVNNSTTSAGGTVTCTAVAGQCIEVVCDVANTSWVMTSTSSVSLTTA